MKRLFLIVLVSFSLSNVFANDYVPGKKQEKPILLKGGNLHTVKNGTLEKTDLLFENGKITQIGKNLQNPSAEVIDVSGKEVYPGLIDASSTLGLIEIDAVRATNDLSEVGNINPDSYTHIAYNPDSELIPTVRVNGITTSHVIPEGELIAGHSSLMNLDGWTKEDANEKLDVGLHVYFPRFAIINAWWMDKSADEQKKQNQEQLEKLDKVFSDAKSYFTDKTANPKLEKDSRWEAMLKVFTKEIPVFIHADEYRQIEKAVSFAKKYDFKMVLVGGKESWKLTELLKENEIPVILGKTQSLPMREDDDYDLGFKIPKLLSEAKVKFCLSSERASWQSRNLPFLAAQTVAFGLSKDEALKSITLSVAEILGVEKNLGSLEIGKKATIIVSEGDILDGISQKVVYEFIEGKKIDLNNKQKELYVKYKGRN
ncbi:amidohydrolase family protein [bacterium]|nr:amidohydrolase family protein [bacterium]